VWWHAEVRVLRYENDLERQASGRRSSGLHHQGPRQQGLYGPERGAPHQRGCWPCPHARLPGISRPDDCSRRHDRDRSGGDSTRRRVPIPVREHQLRNRQRLHRSPPGLLPDDLPASIRRPRTHGHYQSVQGATVPGEPSGQHPGSWLRALDGLRTVPLPVHHRRRHVHGRRQGLPDLQVGDHGRPLSPLQLILGGRSSLGVLGPGVVRVPTSSWREEAQRSQSYRR
jgi:hypothetical protein